jgi:ketosteroid isomerase-like protein
MSEKKPILYSKQTIMNQRIFWGILAIPVFAIFNACAPGEGHVHAPEINQDSVRAQIMAMEQAYAVASNAKDVEGVAAYYASDAQSMANDEPTRVGMDAIKAGIQKEFSSDTSGATVSFETTGIWAAGNYATETGTSTVKDKSGSVIRTGKYMTLFELRDGKYIAIRDMWNNDAPMPAAAPAATPAQ